MQIYIYKCVCVKFKEGGPVVHLEVQSRHVNPSFSVIQGVNETKRSL